MRDYTVWRTCLSPEEKKCESLRARKVALALVKITLIRPIEIARIDSRQKGMKKDDKGIVRGCVYRGRRTKRAVDEPEKWPDLILRTHLRSDGKKRPPPRWLARVQGSFLPGIMPAK